MKFAHPLCFFKIILVKGFSERMGSDHCPVSLLLAD